MEEDATAVKGTRLISVSVTTTSQDRSFCVAAEDSEEREEGFNSDWEGKNNVALLAGWMTSTSSGSEFSCSDREQNGSSTCRNTRVITLHTSYGEQTQTPIQRAPTSRSQERRKLVALILLDQGQSRWWCLSHAIRHSKTKRCCWFLFYTFVRPKRIPEWTQPWETQSSPCLKTVQIGHYTS